MLRFFRQIRQRLLTDNKFSKYLLYAVGEILLVVIGILIALQVDTWNEQRRERILEQDYYCRLLEDIILDDQQIEGLLKASETRLKAANQAVRLLQGESPKKIEVAREINNSIKSIYSDFKSNDAAFVDLKSGANLNIIKDKSAIRALNNYFNKVEGYLSVIRVNGENSVRIFYSHDDVFANGWAPASIKYGWASQGIDADVVSRIPIEEDEQLSEAMRYRLLNESLLFISHNQRQIILYHLIKDEIGLLQSILESKCI
ncbi:MAG: DUF6090 family protein [Robiginitalea sp.]